MKWNKKIIKVLAMLVFLISIGPISWMVYGNNEKNITYSIHEEIIEEGTKVRLQLDIFPNESDIKIKYITLPNENMVENQSTVHYEVNENGDYTFKVLYTVLDAKDNSDAIELEKEEVIFYTVNTIHDKKQPVDAITEEKDELNTPEMLVDGNVEITPENFPDDNLRNFLLEQEYGKDSLLEASELASISRLVISGKGIKDLTGIEYFTSVSALSCGSNQLTNLDVSMLAKLQTLNCDNNELTSLDVSQNIKLGTLYCSNNKLRTLNVGTNTNLRTIYCTGNQLTNVDISRTGVTTFNAITQQIDVSIIYERGMWKSDPSFTYELPTEYKFNSEEVSYSSYGEFILSNGSITSSLVTGTIKSGRGNTFVLPVEITFINKGIEISTNIFGNPAFVSLLKDGNNINGYGEDGWLTPTELDGITSLDVSGIDFSLTGGFISGLDMFTSLTYLNCSNCKLWDLNVAKNTALQTLICSGNELTSLELSNNNNLVTLEASKQSINVDVYQRNNEQGKWQSNSIKVTSFASDKILYDSNLNKFFMDNTAVKSGDFSTDCLDGRGSTQKITGTLYFKYDGFVAVSDIKNIPKTIQIDKTFILSGTIEPSDATEQEIVWSIKDAGETGATLTDNALTLLSPGKLTLTATILGGEETEDYVQEFSVVTYTTPIALVSIPKEITLERILHDEIFEAIKEETVSILETTDTKYFDQNFYVYASPTIRLINTENSNEYFTVQLYDENGSKYRTKDKALAILNSTTKSKNFFIKAFKDLSRKSGIYEGIMNFEIGYGESQ